MDGIEWEMIMRVRVGWNVEDVVRCRDVMDGEVR
jgi:hypothetical protein